MCLAMAKVEKLLKRFRLVFEDQNFHEAHQVARMIYHRWLELDEREKLSAFLTEQIQAFEKGNCIFGFEGIDGFLKVILEL
jgi:predicted metal-dependent hydrolase